MGGALLQRLGGVCQRREAEIQRGALDGMGVDGDGAHTHEERLYISSVLPRTKLLMRLMETLR